MPKASIKGNINPTSVRVSDTCKQLWEDTAKALGISLASTLEIAIRKLAKAEGVAERPVEAKEE
jgi:PIN domain nuclease of toxin-antitoxin system